MTIPVALGRNVPRLLRSNPTGGEIDAVIYPLSGGFRVVDALGAVIDLSGGTTGDALLAGTQTFTGVNTFAPAAGPITAGTASFGINLAATKTLSADTALQPGVLLAAPNYAGAHTATNAGTLVIAGPPTASGGATITNAFSLAVLSGMSTFGGDIRTTGDVSVDGDVVFTGGSPVIDATGASALSVSVGAGGTLQLGGDASSRVGLYATAPVVQALAIAAPTAPGATYSQAEAASAVAAINFIRAAIKNLGVTA